MVFIQDYDVIVIGSGHNDMICANYLAQKRKTVLVLDKLDRPGGWHRAGDFVKASEPPSRIAFITFVGLGGVQ